MSTLTLKGKVKFFLENKGYGFVTDLSSLTDYFFHCSNTIEKNLQKEEQVTFELEEGKRGLKAVNIKRNL